MGTDSDPGLPTGSSGPGDPAPGDPVPGDPGDAADRLRRRILWAMPTGLYVIGSRGELDGTLRWNLMTANLVLQVAVEPKSLAVSVEAGSVTHRNLEATGCYTVNLVAREDRMLVRRFVKPVPVTTVVIDSDGRPSAMGGHEVVVATTGAPILQRAVAWLDCQVRERVELGSHTLFIGTVVDFGGPEGQLPPLLRMEDTRMSYGG
jgi:flavin reductase (DIM6/NTAB) family NADH-FMN oxidoreductase RutF